MSGPARIGFRILVRYLHDRMVHAMRDRASRSLGMAPGGAGQDPPPLCGIREISHVHRSDEDEGPRARIALKSPRSLGDGEVTGLADEARELRVGHVVRVDPESACR